MPREIYISCDKQDKEHEKRLRTALQPTLAQYNLSVWSRSDIVPGQKWKDQMKVHLQGSAFFVPLISANSLASSICIDELLYARYLEQEKKLKIIPVYLRPCMIGDSDLAGRYYLPKNGISITEYTNRDIAWLDVQRGLLQIVNKSQQYLQLA